jgi:hypothetical protein
MKALIIIFDFATITTQAKTVTKVSVLSGKEKNGKLKY